MKTLDKLNIFLVDDKKKTKSNKIKILELFFKYPQPMHGLEAKLYLQNMFDDEFNTFIDKFNDSEDVGQKVACWIYKNYFLKTNDDLDIPNYKKSLSWDKPSETKLKKMVENYLFNN